MLKYFGTDGYRGEANVLLNVEHAFKIGRFLGWYFGRKHKCNIVIGKDTRRSSYMYESALSAGITASGGDAYLLHVTTTPSVSYVAHTDFFDCGIMISASHNPFTDNGIKLVNENGEKMEEEVLAKVEDYIDGRIKDLPLATGDKIGRTVDYFEGRNRYIGYLISLAKNSYRHKKVGLDCANGSTWMIAKSVFDALGATTFVINNTPNGMNINLDCGSTHIEGLQKFVLEKGLDVGFAFDGDGDRCLAVDENGEVVNGDMILYIMARYLNERGEFENSKVVTTVMSNMGLYKALDKIGVGYVKTTVGDRFVYENMQANGYCLGGEQSGHIIFSKYATTGDGVLTAIKIMQVMIDSKMPLSQLVRDVPMYPQVLKNVHVKDKDAALSNEALKSIVKKVEKNLKDQGRVLIRKSGTEPLVRVMVEADNYDICLEYVDSIIDVMKKNGLTYDVI